MKTSHQTSSFFLHYLNLPAITTLLFTFFIFTNVKAYNPDDLISIRVGLKGHPEYVHPGQVDFSVEYLVDLYADDELLPDFIIDDYSLVSFDLLFLVNDELYDWNEEFVNLNINGSPGAVVSWTELTYQGQEGYGVHLHIYDPELFFEANRAASEPDQETPVVLVELGAQTHTGSGLSINGCGISTEECDLPPFYYLGGDQITAVVLNPYIQTFAGATLEADDLTSMSNEDVLDDLCIEFPNCLADDPVINPGNSGNDGGGEGPNPEKNTDSDSFNMNIFPNPANQFINIEISPTAIRRSIELIDLYGKVIAEWEISPGDHKLRMTTGQVTNGQYFIRTENGDQIVTRKIMILN